MENFLKYEHHHRVTFGDTNAEGNMSHDRYASLFGAIRELFALDFIPEFRESVGKVFLLKTKRASYEYEKDFFFGDRILIRMWVGEINHASFVMLAEYIHEESGAAHAKAEQLIVYTNMEGKPRRIPPELKELLYFSCPDKST